MSSDSELPTRRGRAARTNPPTSYERLHVEPDPAALDEEELRYAETEYLSDPSQSILAKNESPDVPFTYSLNPYRGCEHGCVYCYARPTHEYLGFSAGLDFETKILVKDRAPELLAEAFQKPSWEPQVVALSGNTDPYQPVERELALTRRCLRVFLRHRNPVSIVTKSGLVTRDLDLLDELAARDLVQVSISLTSLDPAVAGAMEPRAARPALRLKTIRRLAEAEVPVGVFVAPVVPGLTDEELPAILEAAAEAGAETAAYMILRLPGAVESIFVDWLDRSFPHRKTKVLRRLRSLRDGTLSEHRFGHRMRGKGPWANLFKQMFATTCQRLGLDRRPRRLSTKQFRRLRGGQGDLFNQE